jgi:hypothetical protein
METKTSVVKPTPSGAERIKRGFNRIALVGAVAAFVLFVLWVGLYVFLLFAYPQSRNWTIGTLIGVWMLLSWLIRGFMSEGNSNLPQGDNPH